MLLDSLLESQLTAVRRSESMLHDTLRAAGYRVQASMASPAATAQHEGPLAKGRASSADDEAVPEVEVRSLSPFRPDSPEAISTIVAP